jgi:hypothetical protein
MPYQKFLKKTSDLFHKIMKSQMSLKVTGDVEKKEEKICLYCELPMKLIHPPIKVGIRMRCIYECPNGHTLEVTESID